ncbi:MAG: TetR family transcriptional regulator [Desulfobacterales bacterium]|nr:TetR family transcriptional regulator [Desulfobacterales bacterium]
MPRIVDRDKKRSEIAQKAIEVLAKRGFQATTIQEFADAAGLGKVRLSILLNKRGDFICGLRGDIA